MSHIKKLAILVLLIPLLANAQDKRITISGRFQDPSDKGRKLEIVIFPHGYYWKNYAKPIRDTEIIKSGKFFFRTPAIPENALCVITSYYPNPVPNFVIWANIKSHNSIRFNDGYEGINFTGKGSRRLQLQSDFHRKFSSIVTSGSWKSVDSLTNYFSRIDSTYSICEKSIIANKSFLTKTDVVFLRSYIFSQVEIGKKFHIYAFDGQNNTNEALRPYFSRFIAEFKAYSKKINRSGGDKIFLQSPEDFANLSLLRYQVDSSILLNRQFSLTRYCHYVNKHYKGMIRDELISYALFVSRETTDSMYSDLVKNTFKIVKASFPKHVLSSLQENRIKGANVYNFSLPDTNGVQTHLSDFKNKVVVIDTWHIGCGPCRSMAPYLKEVEKQFQTNSNVEFLSVAVMQATRKEWLEAVHAGEYGSTDVVNLIVRNHNTDLFLQSIGWDGDPTLILLDRNGKLLNNPERPDVDNGKDLTEKINAALKN